MGFPTRITRKALGPLGLRDKIRVIDPETAIGAATYKLAWWQLAGCNLMVPLAWAVIVVDGAGVGTLGASAESWDADGASVPTVNNPAGAGAYQLEYAASYVDEAGTTVSTDLGYANPVVLSTATLWHARGAPSAPNVIDVQVWNAAGAPADPLSLSIFVPIW